MLKKNLSIFFIICIFVFFAVFVIPTDKIYKVNSVYSPISFKLNDEEFFIKDLETFDSKFSDYNKNLAKILNISEAEAFIMGNLANYWAQNLMSNRRVFIKNHNDLIYSRYSYRTKFLYSGFCLKDSKPYSPKTFENKINHIRKAKYKVLDLENEIIYEPDDEKVKTLKNFVVIRKSHLPKNIIQTKKKSIKKRYQSKLFKVFLSDFTTKNKPDRTCASDICKEILYNINSAKESIDIAIYGYSTVPEIEKALISALSRGVNIRLVYDLDSKGENIYPNTNEIIKLIAQNNNDGNSFEMRNIMHNKFYIFDNKTLITGSANLSHTDMSEFNSNSIIVIESKEIAKIYKNEFEQMYKGRFHSEKIRTDSPFIKLGTSEFKVYFSPQDKSITNAILPIIKNAKDYIYIPTFVLTEKRVTEELINAKNRGVDVKIIIDALNASIKHSKHNELRKGGLAVKTENYAGKMHMKSMLVDDAYTIIGSMNFSNSGENKNDENLILIKDSELTKFYKEFFLYQWEKIDNKWLYQNVRAESKDSIGSCYDGIDNNYDGLIDSEDLACK